MRARLAFHIEDASTLFTLQKVVLVENLEHGSLILWDSEVVGSTLETYDSSEEVGMDMVEIAQENLPHDVFFVGRSE